MLSLHSRSFRLGLTILLLAALPTAVVFERCLRRRTAPRSDLTAALEAARAVGFTVTDATEVGMGQHRGRAWWLTLGNRRGD